MEVEACHGANVVLINVFLLRAKDALRSLAFVVVTHEQITMALAKCTLNEQGKTTSAPSCKNTSSQGELRKDHKASSLLASN